MINQEKLKDVIKKYESIFQERWPDEKFKWEAIKNFKKTWDINAENFAEMFHAATDNLYGFLGSMNNFPRRMIYGYALQDPETVRGMFLNLYDESKDMIDRMIQFQAAAEELCNRLSPGMQHYQRPMAITVYLWLKYPEKYNVYKYTVCRDACRFLESSFVPKKGDTPTNIKGNDELISTIAEAIAGEQSLAALYHEALDDSCYEDPSYRNLAFDICYYISARLLKETPPDDIKETQPEGNKEELSEEMKIDPEQDPSDDSREETVGDVQDKKPDDEKPADSAQNKSSDDEKLIDGTQNKNPVAGIPDDKHIESYTKEDFLSQVFMTEEKYDTLVALLKRKKNVILQGAPGVGKTFAAKRLAYSMMGVKDESRVELIQFHQSYSYEDFILGYKPNGDGFALQEGVLYRFCQKAAKDPDQPYFFMIDEINRGNLSKIFGELLMLIEKDYRGTKAVLAYDGRIFSVPENVYLIGMMNTADRSLAMIDYALRRRFSFYLMEPGFTSEGFQKYMKKLDNETFNLLIEKVMDLNGEISKDSSLGSGFCIGHSYFCNQTECTDEWMQSVVEYDIIPTLEEYWFDEPTKLQKWQNILRGVFND